VDITAPPKFAFPAALTVTIGLVACIVAFAARKFTLLFISAGLTVDFSSILFVSIVAGRVSWCSWPPEDLQGIAVLVGFLIFTGAWYMIVRFDPSLK
jgi:hypothetical protein